MSIIKSIKLVLGLSVTPSENFHWDGSVANKLSLKRGVPGAEGITIFEADGGKIKTTQELVYIYASSTPSSIPTGLATSTFGSGWVASQASGMSVNSSGQVTIPVSGLYFLNTIAKYTSAGVQASVVTAQVFINNQVTLQGSDASNNATGYPSPTVSACMYLNAGDVVRAATIHNASGTANNVAMGLNVALMVRGAI